MYAFVILRVLQSAQSLNCLSPLISLWMAGHRFEDFFNGSKILFDGLCVGVPFARECETALRRMDLLAFTLGEQITGHGTRGSYMGAIAQQRCIQRSAIVQNNLDVEDHQSNKVFEDAVGQ